MVEFGIGRCHPLKGNYKGCYALDLEHPYRLIVEPVFDENNETTCINIVKLLEVTDYHGN
jgi:proteic killer suppression protein